MERDRRSKRYIEADHGKTKLVDKKRKRAESRSNFPGSPSHRRCILARTAGRKGEREIRAFNTSSDSESDNQFVLKNRRRTTKITQSSKSDSLSEGYSSGGRNETLYDLLDASTSDYSNDRHNDRKRKKPRNCFGDVRVNKGATYYRSNLKTCIKELKGLRFDEAHIREMKKTPFWLMFNAIYKSDTERLKKRCAKHEDDIREIMMSYDDLSESFIIGGELMTVTNRDVQLIFGVSGGSETIPLKVTEYELPPWIGRCFGWEIHNSNGQYVLYKTYIYEKLKEMLGRQDETSFVDVARLTHCYLMAAVLAPNQNASMAWHLTAYLDNFEEICHYDWCTLIVAMLRSQIRSSKSLKAGGCAIILPFWLCEHTRLIKPVNEVGFPRFLKWDLNELNRKLSWVKLAQLDPKYVRKLKLKPMTSEKDSFRALLRFCEAQHQKLKPMTSEKDSFQALLRFCEAQHQKQHNDHSSDDEDNETMTMNEDHFETTVELGMHVDLNLVKEASLSKREMHEEIPALSKNEDINREIETPLVLNESIQRSSINLDGSVVGQMTDKLDDIPSFSLNISQNVSTEVQLVVADDVHVSRINDDVDCLAYFGKLDEDNQNLRTQLEEYKRFVLEKNSEIERLNLTLSTLRGNFDVTKEELKAEMKGYVVSKLKEDRLVQRATYEAEIKRREEELRMLRAENEDLRSRVKAMTVPTPSHFYENPDNIETIEELHLTKIQNQALMNENWNLIDTIVTYDAIDKHC